MTSQIKLISCLFVVALVALFFYTNLSCVPATKAVISSKSHDIAFKKHEWYDFIELEASLASSHMMFANYENFASELDKIFDETSNYNEALWDYAINKIQRGFPQQDLAVVKSILKCYREYRYQMKPNKEFLMPNNEYAHLFRQRIKYFGLEQTRTLYAAELSFLLPHMELPNQREVVRPICHIASLH